MTNIIALAVFTTLSTNVETVYPNSDPYGRVYMRPLTNRNEPRLESTNRYVLTTVYETSYVEFNGQRIEVARKDVSRTYQNFTATVTWTPVEPEPVVAKAGSSLFATDGVLKEYDTAGTNALRILSTSMSNVFVDPDLESELKIKGFKP